MSMADEERPPNALETALWCNLCLLPSAMRFAVAGTDRSQVFCFDCQHYLDEEGIPID